MRRLAKGFSGGLHCLISIVNELMKLLLAILLYLWHLWTPPAIAYLAKYKSAIVIRQAYAAHMSLGASNTQHDENDEESELAEMLLDMYHKGLIHNPTDMEDSGGYADEGDGQYDGEKRKVYTGKPRQVIKVSDTELKRAREALAAKKVVQDHLDEGAVLSADELIALMEEDPVLTESVDLDSLKGIVGLTQDIEDVPDDLQELSQQLNAAFESAAIMNSDDAEGSIPKDYLGKNTFPNVYDDEDPDSPEVALRRMNEVDLFVEGENGGGSTGNMLNVDDDMDNDYEDYEDYDQAELEVLKERSNRDPSEQGDLDLGNVLRAKGMLSQLLETMGDPNDLSKMQAEMRDKSTRHSTGHEESESKQSSADSKSTTKKTKTGVDLDEDIKNILDYIDDGLDIGSVDASTAYVMKKMKGNKGNNKQKKEGSKTSPPKQGCGVPVTTSQDVLKLLRKVAKATGRTNMHDEVEELSGSESLSNRDEVEIERVQIMDLTEAEREERQRQMLAEVAQFQERMSTIKGEITKKRE